MYEMGKSFFIQNELFKKKKKHRKCYICSLITKYFLVKWLKQPIRPCSVTKSFDPKRNKKTKGKVMLGCTNLIIFKK